MRRYDNALSRVIGRRQKTTRRERERMTSNPDNKRKISERDETHDAPSPTHENRRRIFATTIFEEIEKMVLDKLNDGLSEVTLDQLQRESLENVIFLIKKSTAGQIDEARSESSFLGDSSSSSSSSSSSPPYEEPTGRKRRNRSPLGIPVVRDSFLLYRGTAEIK